MGLGKTLQVLALLNSTQRQLPWLVVCPTSLVWNWAAEAEKFVPDLKVLVLHGAERHASFERAREVDLVITSYALVRRDADFYRDTEFDTVVLDEAQHIKNRQTQNAQAVKGIKSQHRLVLTGTPIENSVLDLWSIFDFLMPGYIGSAQDFRERYEVPIVREKSEVAQTRLNRRLRPFVLRRTKREVAPELPPKVNQISFCELSDSQAALYKELLVAARREVLESADPASGRSR
jgi:SNF2 family DNA or RNA helicase